MFLLIIVYCLLCILADSVIICLNVFLIVAFFCFISIQLILMDFVMPVMDGPTATAAIRASGCDSIILGVTGNMMPDDVAHFRECGAASVFPKPTSIDVIEAYLYPLWN